MAKISWTEIVKNKNAQTEVEGTRTFMVVETRFQIFSSFVKFDNLKI